MPRFLVGCSLGWMVACSAAAPARSPVVAPVVAPVAAKVAASPAPSAVHERVVALAIEGDATVKVSVDAAIEKYAEALRLEPDNIDVLWKVSHDAANCSQLSAILNQFIERTCRSAAGANFRVQCELSASTVQRLARDPDVHGPVAPATPSLAPVALLPGLPTPQLVMQPQRVGEAYTVWGAGYAFRGRHHHGEVTDKPIAIVGYVVKTNLSQAPRCAVHRGGMADPDDCRADIPAFWLGDRVDAPEADCIKVMGFASNYAQLYDAIRQADSRNRTSHSAMLSGA